MPSIVTQDGVRLYYEEAGQGTPVIFVHEYAADYRTWEPQMQRFSRSNRCVTFSQRGYLPSDVPEAPDMYSQDAFRDDIAALMDGLGIKKAHIVGHSMGAMTAVHFGIRYPDRCISVTAAGCGYGSSPDPKIVEEARTTSREVGEMFATETMEIMAPRYADGATRQTFKHKDPRGYAHFVKMLSEHSALGHSLTMINLQAKRPALHEMESELRAFSVPLFIIVGDEDDWCVDASLYLRRMVPTSGLLVIPRASHTITSEEPDKFNEALAEFLSLSDAGRWLSHKPAKP